MDETAPSLFRGVSLNRRSKKWLAQYCGGRGMQQQLGHYDDQQSAARATCDYVNKSKKRKAQYAVEDDDDVTPNNLKWRKLGKVADFSSRFAWMHNFCTTEFEEPCYPGAREQCHIREIKIISFSSRLSPARFQISPKI